MTSPYFANSLFDISKKMLINMTVDALYLDSFQTEHEIKRFRETYLPCLNQHFQDELMNDLMLLHANSTFTTGISTQIAQMFLSEGTRTFKYCFLDVHCTILDLIRPFLQNFAHLEYNNYYLHGYEWRNIFSRRMDNLKILKLKTDHFINFEFVGTILRNAPNLNELVLFTNSYKYLELPILVIKSWPRHEKLITLKFKMKVSENNSPAAVEMILQKFPNLKFFRFSENLGAIVSWLIPKMRLNLKEIRDYRTNLNSIHTLLKFHPNIQSFVLYRPQYDVINTLSNFRALVNISLDFFREEELMNLVNKCGPQFKSLKLKNGCGFNLTFLLEKCPNLNFLTLESNDDVFIDNHVVDHHNLKRFTVYPNLEDLDQVLLGLVGIESLDIHEWTTKEENLPKLIPNWRNLKSIYFHKAAFITMDTFTYIINQCPKLEEVYPEDYYKCSNSFYYIMYDMLRRTTTKARIKSRKCLMNFR